MKPFYEICIIETTEDMFIACTASARTLWGAKRKAKNIAKLLPSCRVLVCRGAEQVAEFFSDYNFDKGDYIVYEQYL